MKSLPQGALIRSGRFAKAGISTGGNYIRHYLGNSLPIKSFHQDKRTLNRKNALSIFKELSQLRGLPLKLAQGLSMDTGLLPIEFMEVMSSAQYSVSPMNRALVRTQFKRYLNDYPENLFQLFDYEAFAAATIGQVHHAVDFDGVHLAVKIQYPNVRKSIHSDLKLLSLFGKQFFKEVSFEHYLKEVRDTFLAETDYLNEGSNIQKFRDVFKSKDLIFPEYRKSTSNEQVLTMTFLKGDHLDQLLQKRPDQNIRNNYGQILWNFFHDNINSKDNIFHADVHPGNFLFCEGGKVAVIDFGCVKVFPELFIKSCTRLVQKYLNGDQDGFLNELECMGFIKNASETSIKEKKIEELFRNFAEILGSIYEKPMFNFGDVNFRKKLNNLFQQGIEIKEVRGSEHFIFFNRITFGLMSILMKLESNIETKGSREIIMNS
ncbi:MAG: ABC1 kinase family protein [Rhodobacterales bacterium]